MLRWGLGLAARRKEWEPPESRAASVQGLGHVVSQVCAVRAHVESQCGGWAAAHRGLGPDSSCLFSFYA